LEKLGGDHKTRRTAAIASLNVGWCLLYQAAGWGRTTVLGFRINPCAQKFDDPKLVTIMPLQLACELATLVPRAVPGQPESRGIPDAAADVIQAGRWMGASMNGTTLVEGPAGTDCRSG
jgi:hypothetical protein